MPRMRRIDGRMREVLIHVCVTCRREGDDPLAPRAGAQLRQSVADLAGPGLSVVPVECLGNCKRACSLAMQASGAWTYVFGDLSPDSGADVIAAATLLASTSEPLMPWRGRPEAFKRGMIARVPPLHAIEEAAE